MSNRKGSNVIRVSAQKANSMNDQCWLVKLFQTMSKCLQTAISIGPETVEQQFPDDSNQLLTGIEGSYRN